MQILIKFSENISLYCDLFNAVICIAYNNSESILINFACHKIQYTSLFAGEELQVFVNCLGKRRTTFTGERDFNFSVEKNSSFK